MMGYYSWTTVKARKDWSCNVCPEKIPEGKTYFAYTTSVGRPSRSLTLREHYMCHLEKKR
jgi:hypothetical protein